MSFKKKENTKFGRFNMIVKDMYCDYCKQETLHECQSNELWRCVQCQNTRFEIINIPQNEIDWEKPVRYLWRSGDIAYVTSALAPDILRLDEMKELLEGKRIRIPLFKIKEKFLPKYY